MKSRNRAVSAVLALFVGLVAVPGVAAADPTDWGTTATFNTYERSLSDIGKLMKDHTVVALQEVKIPSGRPFRKIDCDTVDPVGTQKLPVYRYKYQREYFYVTILDQRRNTGKHLGIATKADPELIPRCVIVPPSRNGRLFRAAFGLKFSEGFIWTMHATPGQDQFSLEDVRTKVTQVNTHSTAADGTPVPWLLLGDMNIETSAVPSLPAGVIYRSGQPTHSRSELDWGVASAAQPPGYRAWRCVKIAQSDHHPVEFHDGAERTASCKG
ncbi:hypothetical protein V5P93_002729 [Actinokineospora auranticolor]|uniref:Endonuclease/exonuclease/phosphatase family protein n=1 Tax=Actinokineospora auranticolor TaxID=155976 RepID=A0A2S6H0D0_9PSEU|nr:hypothetical protein [Actinokineospora auranticolor]PPK70867.1 hypothetical protein CLV40_10153 [Actinokineospora auranticolor]